MDNPKKISIVFSILILPFMVLVVIPLLILIFTVYRFSWKLDFPLILLPTIFGFILIIFGIYLLIITIKLFYGSGKGTLAPWDPPKKLVIIGPYKYIRNPMISAVLLVLLGEAMITGSLVLCIWFVIFLIINIIYIIYFEEPELIKRFGNDYIKYKNAVPMFVPKLKIKKSRIYKRDET
jgi:protein-S-isoprenylcysteine O-methyltransferase Ste14